MIPLLLLALATTTPPTTVQSDEFDVTVVEMTNAQPELRVGLVISNKMQAGRLFVHLEPNEGDANTVLFMPPVKPVTDPFTYYLKGERDPLPKMLVFPADETATSSVIVVGEATPPYRQTAIALDLTRSISKAASSTSLEPVSSAILPRATATTPPTPDAPSRANKENPPASTFDVTIDKLVSSQQGLRVGMTLENKVHAERLFIHFEPHGGELEAASFIPPAKSSKDRYTHYFNGGHETMKATLLFPVDKPLTSPLLIVGEATAPYRQTAVALDLAKAHEPTPPPRASAPSASFGRVVATFHPPFQALGETIVLKSGKEGPEGNGWIRIYTDLPDVSLNQLGEGIEHPQQIWAGPERLLFIVKLTAKRAIAVDVRNGEIQTARYIDKIAFEQMVGPGTPYPKRVFMGK